MSSVIEEMKAAKAASEQELQDKRSQDYWDVVHALADGKKLAPQRVQAVIDGMGLSLDELQDAVREQQERDRMAVELAEAYGARTVLTQCDADLKMAQADQEAFAKSHKERVRAILDRQAAALCKVGNIQPLERRLVGGCPYAHLEQEATELEARRKQIGAQINVVTERRGRSVECAERQRRYVAKLTGEGTHLGDQHRARETRLLEQYEANVATHSAELKKLSSEARAVDAREAAVRIERMKPR